MPTICMFRGIKIYINYSEHNPPHFHAVYCGQEIAVYIHEIEVMKGSLPSRQQKMLLGWAALHQEELTECWNLAAHGEEPFAIAPLQ